MASIGQELRQAREARKLTIKQVVQATRIRGYYIEAMEADDFSILPSAVQAKGFLRSYSQYLGLNLDELSAEKTIKPEPEAAPPPPQPEPEPEPEPAPVAPSPAPAPPPVIERSETPRESKPSDLIFQEIGAQLRQRRELLSLTLDEVERHTKVRKGNLRFIEQGDFDGLASPVQSRGMLKAYTSFLDLDADAILLRFAEAIQVRHVERQPTAQKSPRRPRWTVPYWVKWFVSPDLLFGGMMILAVTGLSLWGALYFIENNQPSASQSTEGPSISDVLLATSEIDLTLQAATDVALTSEAGAIRPQLTDVTIPTNTPLPVAPGAFLQVTIIIRERTLVRVIVDGEVKENSRLAPGAALTFDGNERIEILTGNGAAVQVIYNQSNQGPMGASGQVANYIYTVEGIQTPTPTSTPTVTNTPRGQRSPTPSPTITPPTPEP